MTDEGDSVFCNNCKRGISAQNAEIHLLHCRRNIQLCELCDEPIPRTQLLEHHQEEHQEIECTKCQVKFPQGEDTLHERVCTMSEIRCDYCDLSYPRNEIATHSDFCGTRTDTCPECEKRVMLKEMLGHVCQTRLQPVQQNGTSTTGLSTSPYSLQPTATYRQTNLQKSEYDMGTAAFQDNYFGGEGPRDYLDELISTNIDITNGSTVDLDGALAAQLAHDLRRQEEHDVFPGILPPPRERRTSQRSRGSEDLIPCEFCDTMVPLDDLILHQTGCVDNHIISHRQPPNIDDIPQFEEDSFIPCEFCCKQFPVAVISQHQAGCTPVRRTGPPTYQQILDERPIRPARVSVSDTSNAPSTPPTNRNRQTAANAAPRVPRRINKPLHPASSFSQNNIQHNRAVVPDMVQPEVAGRPKPNSRPGAKPKKALVSKPKMTLGNPVKEPARIKNSRRTLNDLDKVTESPTKPPSVIIPKRKPAPRGSASNKANNRNVAGKNKEPLSRANHVTNGEHSGTSNRYQPITGQYTDHVTCSQPITEHSGTSNGVSHDLGKRRTNGVSNIDTTTNILKHGSTTTGQIPDMNNLAVGSMNNLAGTTKKNLCGKDVTIDLNTPPRTRQNVLNKYKRGKTFVVNKDEEDE